MIMCVLLCYPVSIRIYYQQGGRIFQPLDQSDPMFEQIQGMFNQSDSLLTLDTEGTSDGLFPNLPSASGDYRGGQDGENEDSSSDVIVVDSSQVDEATFVDMSSISQAQVGVGNG